MSGDMAVFLVQYDGENRVVEAEHFGAALEVWRAGLSAENDEDYSQDMPDSMQLISSEPVLRALKATS